MIEQRLEEYLKPLQSLAGINAYFAFIITDRALLPAVTYFRVDTQRDYSHSGEDGHRESRLQVTVWATSYAQTKTLGQAMSAALGSWTGGYSDVTIHGTEIIDERDTYDESEKLYGVMIDLAVRHTDV